MKPEDITFERVHENCRRPHYVSRSGWGVFPDGVLAGDVLAPWDHSVLPNRELIVAVDTSGSPCDFCSSDDHEALVAERGVIRSDYKLITLDKTEIVARTCHACIDEHPVARRGEIEYDVEDVYLRA